MDNKESYPSLVCLITFDNQNETQCTAEAVVRIHVHVFSGTNKNYNHMPTRNIKQVCSQFLCQLSLSSVCPVHMHYQHSWVASNIRHPTVTLHPSIPPMQPPLCPLSMPLLRGLLVSW